MEVIDRRVDSIPSSWHLLKQKLAGSSYQKIADKYSTSKQNVQQRIQRLADTLNSELQLLYMDKPNEAIRFIEGALINELGNHEKIKKANLVQLSTAYGTIYDKRRLEEGKSTENVDFKALISMEQELKGRINKPISVKESDNNNTDCKDNV